MKIEGCAYEGLDETEKFFFTAEVLFCQNCGSLQERSGQVVFGGHIHTDSFCGDILVWTKPIKCFYCDHLIRDLILPCSDYILNLEIHELPSAY